MKKAKVFYNIEELIAYKGNQECILIGDVNPKIFEKAETSGLMDLEGKSL